MLVLFLFVVIVFVFLVVFPSEFLVQSNGFGLSPLLIPENPTMPKVAAIHATNNTFKTVVGKKEKKKGTNKQTNQDLNILKVLSRKRQ